MPEKKNSKGSSPEGYQPLKGSERHPSKAAKLLGPAAPEEAVKVTIAIRRRPDGPPVPDFDYFAKTPLSQRRRMPQDEFAAKYGAASDDIDKVMEFAQSQGLKIVETHPGRRTVVVSGTVGQMSKAFGVSLGRYQHEIPHPHHPRSGTAGRRPRIETYRGRDGAIHVPNALADIVVGVFGLDNRTITGSNGQPGDPTNTAPITIQQATQLYKFPAPPPGISQQTIGILSPSNGFGGYFQSDLQSFFGAAMPTVVPVTVDAANGSIEAITSAQTNVGQSTLTFPSTPGIQVGSSIIVGTAVNQLGGYTVPANSFGPAVMSVSTTATATTVTVGTFDFATGIWTAANAASVVPTGTSVYFNLDNETTQDICIAASASAASSGTAGASVAVYFSTGDELGWVDMIHRAVHPSPGDFPAGMNPASVLSSSFYISGGDDPFALAFWGVSTNLIDAVHATLQDAAIQGLTVCIASGDYGSNSLAGNNGSGGDGKAHVQYPASDPWVLSVGGTTLGGNSAGSPPPWVEFVWNDASGAVPAWGTTGGGVSDFFALPSYQSSAGVPNSINTTADAGFPPFNTTGRGVPDVAANASYNSGYSGLYFAGASNWYFGNGTSASAPFWAGFVALLNANLGFNLGFINALLYALGPSVFDAINPLNPALPALAGCPTNNGNSGVPGYPAGTGWDACTGLGSPNGVAMLNAIKTGLAQDCYFIVDTDAYDEGAVQVAVSASGSIVFPQAFFIVIEGFSANQLGISVATVSNAITNPPTVQPAFTGIPGGMSVSGPVSVQPAEALSSAGLNSPQRFTYAYNITFTNTSAFPPTSGQTSAITIGATVQASVSGSNVTVSSSAVFQLINQPGPFMAGGSGISWLSSDVRVFQVEPGEWTVPDPPFAPAGTGILLGNTGNPAADATTFIQNVVQSLNSGTNIPPASIDPSPGGPVRSYFDLIPTDESASALDLLPTDPATNLPVYNFALARIRYDSSAIAAQNVRAFFRLFPAMSASTSFEPTTTYRRWTSGTEAIPLYGLDSSGNVITIPCFAEPRVDASTVSVETQTDPANVQTIPANGGEADMYFGCWLDINQSTGQYPLSVAGLSNPDGPFTASSLQTIQQLLRNQHTCMTVEIAYDPDPIPVGSGPSTSGPLAQRNLSLGTAANPGHNASRRVPNTFMIRPTPAGLLPDRTPDELMIDWRNTPAGSVGSIYLPQVGADQVLKLAAEMYTTHNLTMTDSHTLEMPASGITYIPLPPGTNVVLPGLISVDLPLGIRKGQSFQTVVRQITGARLLAVNLRATQSLGWRRVLGSFQVTTLVKTKEIMLAPEERLLSVMKWIQQGIPPTDLWFEVMQRYVKQIAARVAALGGDPDAILPSPNGGVTTVAVQGGQPHRHHRHLEFIGKVNSLKYDRFGDFEGFFLRSEHDGEHWFESREEEIEVLAQRAWAERMRVTISAREHSPHRVESVVLRGVPRFSRH